MEQDARVAYFCFLDIVGYSKRSSYEQVSTVEKIQSIFRKTISSMGTKEGDYLSIATGDGLVVCFWDKPESAIIFALDFSRALTIENSKLLPEYRLKLRMGIHFGPVLQVVDVTGNRNVAGNGINICQRIMSLGQPGQILSSDIVFRLLSEHEQFASLFQSLGSFSVKHGVVIDVFNIYGTWKGSEIGNSAPPAQTPASELTYRRPPSERYAFIIMGMNPEDPMLVDVHSCIKSVCARTNIRAERVDDIEYSGKITDRIIDSIQKADIVIADLTHERPNVYYEIGFSHGQNNDVILIARRETKLHFDLSGFNVIYYRNITELSEKLEKRIKAVLGD